MSDIKLDSKEGITILLDWARACGAILNPGHERIATKYGVPTEGVQIQRQIPCGTKATYARTLEHILREQSKRRVLRPAKREAKP